jgi:hypothetical protein
MEGKLDEAFQRLLEAAKRAVQLAIQSGNDDARKGLLRQKSLILAQLDMFQQELKAFSDQIRSINEQRKRLVEEWDGDDPEEIEADDQLLEDNYKRVLSKKLQKIKYIKLLQSEIDEIERVLTRDSAIRVFDETDAQLRKAKPFLKADVKQVEKLADKVGDNKYDAGEIEVSEKALERAMRQPVRRNRPLLEASTLPSQTAAQSPRSTDLAKRIEMKQKKQAAVQIQGIAQVKQQHAESRQLPKSTSASPPPFNDQILEKHPSQDTSPRAMSPRHSSSSRMYDSEAKISPRSAAQAQRVGRAAGEIAAPGRAPEQQASSSSSTTARRLSSRPRAAVTIDNIPS